MMYLYKYTYHRKSPVTIASQIVPQILFHGKQTKMTVSAEIKKGGGSLLKVIYLRCSPTDNILKHAQLNTKFHK